jgi:hypothetical protein
VAIQFFEPAARAVARCPCGGLLRLVEDAGPRVPVEAQCDRCLELSGVAHELAAGPAPAPQLEPAAQTEAWPF